MFTRIWKVGIFCFLMITTSFFEELRCENIADLKGSDIVLGNVKVQKKDITQSNEDWYNTNLDYVKITTSKDGIGIVTAKELIKFMPSWQSKSSEFFHLIYKGTEIPLKMFNDIDHLLNNNDYFIFNSKRAEGDTTWFNNYSNEAPFFLYYDESSTGLRFHDLSEIPEPEQEIKKIKFFKHFEQEKEYLYGYDHIDIENTAGEGWAWAILNPNTINKFVDSTIFSNIGIIQDSITVTIECYSAAFVIVYPFQHKLRVVINGDTITTNEFLGGQKFQLKFKLSPNDIFPSSNIFEIITLGYPNYDATSTNKYTNPDDVGIDFITIEGMTIPVEFNEPISFQSETNDYNSKFVAYQKSQDYYNIDNNNNLSLKSKSNGGSIVRIGTKSTKPYTNITINDKAYTTTKKGFHILALKGNSFKDYEFKTFTNPDNSATSYINSLPNETVIALANNSGVTISQDLKTLLTSLGSSKVNSLAANDNWAFITQKGGRNYYESAKNGIANVYGFVYHINPIYAENTYYLYKNYNYSLILSTISDTSQTQIFKVAKSDLKSRELQAYALIVTHPDFKSAADSLASYRSRTNEGKIVLSIDVEDIYKEFNYGVKSPHAIKNFLKYVFTNWKTPAPKYLNLFGDASWDCRNLLSTSKYNDYLPTYGYPASDYWYSLILNDDYIADIAVGRIPVASLPQAYEFINKLIDYDTIPNNLWMKDLLYLSGGDETKMAYFGEQLRSLARYLKKTGMCIDTTVINKRDPTVGAETESPEIIKSINQGTAWVTFLGHGSTSVFDMDGWQVYRLNNKNKYGFLSTISCNTGAFAEPNVITRNEEYILSPDKGFICAAGGTYTGFADYLTEMHKKVMHILADSSSKLVTYTELLDSAKTYIIDTRTGRIAASQFCYLGDPMTKIRIKQRPDLYFRANSVIAVNSSNNQIITDNDTTAIINGTIDNIGYKQSNTVEIMLIREYEDNIPDTIVKDIAGVCMTSDFLFDINILGKPGYHYFKLIIDPNKRLLDDNYSNNTYYFSKYIYTQGLLALDPLPYWNVSPKNPDFRVINQLSKDYSFEYFFDIISNFNGEIATIVKSSSDNEIIQKENYIEWRPKIELPAGSNYWLQIKANNLDLDKMGKSSLIPFNVSNNQINDEVDWNIRGKNQLQTLKVNNFFYDSLAETPQMIMSYEMIPYIVRGVRGVAGISERGCEITIGVNNYIITPPLHRGFNVVVMDNKTFEGKIKRTYDTWGDTLSSINLVKFLRDSIPENHSIMLATCDEAFRIPIQQMWSWKYRKGDVGIGSLDTLKAELRKFGASLFDSIVVPEGKDIIWYSYAMIGQKGAPVGSIKEVLIPDGDTALITGEFKSYIQNADIHTDLIGPATKWNKFKLSGTLFSDSSELFLSVIGYDIFGTEKEVIKSEKNTDIIDLSDISAIQYPYIKIQAAFDRKESLFEPKIRSIDLDFIPSPEFAIIQSEGYITNDSIIRGEKMEYNITLENISKRTSSEQSYMNINIYSETGELLNKYLSIDPIEPNDIKYITHSVYTDSYSELNFILAKINDELLIPELYTFNNSIRDTFKIFEDDINPWILLMMDSVRVNDGDYVSIQPRLDITLFDNSPLEIFSKNKLQLRINASWQDTTQTTFVSFGREVPQKASITYNPDSLDYGENIIRIYAEDATGNRDTLIISVFVSLNGYVQEITNFPNPFTTYTNIDFTYLAPNHNGVAKVDIFNQSGSLIRTLKQELFLGKNQLNWDTRDDSGNTIPSGVYFYRITVDSEVWVEPVFGKFLYLK